MSTREEKIEVVKGHLETAKNIASLAENAQGKQKDLIYHLIENADRG